MRLVWGFVNRWFVGVLAWDAHCWHCGYLFSSQLPRTYEGRVKLLAMPSSSANGATDYNGLLAAERLTTTYAELARTRPVVEAATRAGQLNLSYEEVVGQVDATPIRNTQLLQLTARAGDPDQAAALAASQFDGVLLVVDAQRTRGRDAAYAAAMLRNAGGRVVGGVLNRALKNNANYYYDASKYSTTADLRPTIGERESLATAPT